MDSEDAKYRTAFQSNFFENAKQSKNYIFKVISNIFYG